MAFVLIQHLDPTHPSYLSEALARATSLPVHEIQDGMHVEPDHVYVIPSDADVGILNGTLALATPAGRRSASRICRSTSSSKPWPPSEETRRSASCLSGTGSDGAEGLRAIKAEDGVTFAQEPAVCQVQRHARGGDRSGRRRFLPCPSPSSQKNCCESAAIHSSAGATPKSSRPPKDDGELKKVLLLVRRRGRGRLQRIQAREHPAAVGSPDGAAPPDERSRNTCACCEMSPPRRRRSSRTS